jgi:hypothetical protein
MSTMEAAAPSELRVASLRKDHHVQYTVRPGTVAGVVVIDVAQAAGIDHVRISWSPEAAPASLILELPFAYLEHFSVSRPEASFASGVLSHGERLTLPTTITPRDSSAVPLDAGDPRHLSIDRIEKETGGAGMRIFIPAALLESTSALELNWIDLYR